MVVLFEAYADDEPALFDSAYGQFADVVERWLHERDTEARIRPTIAEFAGWAAAQHLRRVGADVYDLEERIQELCRQCYCTLDGDGWDGLCGDCADRAFAAELDEQQADEAVAPPPRRRKRGRAERRGTL